MSSQKLLAQLALVCSSCDHFNAPGSQSCASCGALLDAPARGAPAPAARPAGAPLGDAPTITSNYARPPAVAATPPRTTSAPSNPAIPAATTRPGASALTMPQPPAAPPPAAAAGAPPNLRPARPAAMPGQPIPAQPGRPAAMAAAAAVPARPAPAAPAPLAAEPIPASELLKKPKPPAPAPSASTNAARYALVVVAGPATGQKFRLAGAGFVLGRSRGAILFPDDPFISAHHATFSVRDGRLYVRDENSASGVYVTIHGQELITPQGYFVAANRLFRFTGAIQPTPPQPGRPIVYGAPMPTSQALFGVEEILVGGRPGRAVITAAPLLTIGSSKCDLCFPNEAGLAARHCELSPQLPQAMLRDLSGGLGTFVRLQPAVDRVLTPGDRIRVGEQIIEVEALA